MSRSRMLMALAGAAAAWCAGPLPVVHAARAAGGGGAWGEAIEVPGLAALNAGGTALVVSVSCASAGGCAAGGSYTGGHVHGQAFVVSQRRGRWGSAIRVPGTVTLNTAGSAGVNAVPDTTPRNIPVPSKPRCVPASARIGKITLAGTPIRRDIVIGWYSASVIRPTPRPAAAA